MSTAAISSTSHVAVEAQRTAVSRADIRGAIGRAYEKIYGHAASKDTLDTLTAQASLETGSGESMYNFNFGGIKGGAPGTNETAKLRTKEVYDGKEVEIRDGFRAYRSLDAGAEDYVRLLKNQSGKAMNAADAGNINGFAHALKEAHYYTADESKYASALNLLAGRPDGAASSPSSLTMSGHGTSHVSMSNINDAINGMGATGSGSYNDYPGTVELSRVLDAIGRHPKPADDEDE